MTPGLGPEPPLVELSSPEPGRPLLVTGLRSAALLDGTGEFRLARETRGGVVEWGGVYGEGIRLTGPWTIRLVTDRGAFELADGLEHARATRWSVESSHRIDGVSVEQSVAAVGGPEGLPAVGRRLTLVSTESTRRLRVEATFAPFLAPVLVEGVKPYIYRVETRGESLVVSSHGFALSHHSSPLPTHLSVNRASWIGGRLTGEVGEVMADYDVELRPGMPAEIAWVVAGGLERSATNAGPPARAALPDSPNWVESARAGYSEWLGRTPAMSLPGFPRIERGYALARGALRQLYHLADPDLVGLVAGYPWYASVWGRDLAWMLPAVLWLGDAEWADRSLRSSFRFQARVNMPILGATAGEMPMQVTAGPLLLYGTSDTTLHYPSLVLRLANHTGQRDRLSEFGEPLDRIERWAAAKVDPSSGFFTNGGEVAEIRDASGEVGSVHYGFDAKDTTIWDSTDRRDHAVDVQVLYIQSLHALSRVAEAEGRPADFARLEHAARDLTQRFVSRFDWGAEGYLYDSLRRDGGPVTKVRPNALRAVSAGLLTPEKAKAIVARAARGDLATPWGLRTLSAADPAYSPTAYHDGQVWTISTAWLADAAFATGDVEAGVRYLTLNADRIASEGGLANECYRGDRDEPYDSCFLLGFSVAPFLTVLFERLWGIQPFLMDRRVRVEPRLPIDGSPSALRGLRLADGTLDLAFDGGRLTARWSGPGDLTIVSGDREAVVTPGAPATLETPAFS